MLILSLDMLYGLVFSANKTITLLLLLVNVSPEVGIVLTLLPRTKQWPAEI